MCDIERLADLLVSQGVAIEPFLRRVRFAVFVRALRQHRGNYTRAARSVGIDRRTFKRILEEGVGTGSDGTRAVHHGAP